MSIVRKGLSEDPKYAAGYEAIFGGKKTEAPSAKPRSSARNARQKKKKKK